MASIYARGTKLWMKTKQAGRWVAKITPFTVGQETDARKYAKRTQENIDRREPLQASGPLTVRAYAEVSQGKDHPSWLQKREREGHDWKADQGRLKKHVFPIIGPLLLADVRAHHIADMVHKLRFPAKSDNKIAPRTLRNIYSVVAAMFRDAALDGRALVETTPCMLTEAQLGPVEDLDPHWRDGAIFTRVEAEILISHPKIPFDRQLGYAFGLLSGTRPGEVGALTWRQYDATTEPLGRLLIATAYVAKRGDVGRTKTRAVRNVPVHPTLAAMLAEWRLSGWEAMMGRKPTPDDLILPVPPDMLRYTRTGSEVRDYNYNGYRWREYDLPMLGWRARSFYDTKATFISLVIEDGANADVIRNRVTHTKAKRDAFSGYDRGPHWIEACNEVAKLRLSRRGLGTPLGTVIAFSSENRSASGGTRTLESGPHGSAKIRNSDEESGIGSDGRGSSREADVTSLGTALAQAVLDGDRVLARKLAEQILGLSSMRAVK